MTYCLAVTLLLAAQNLDLSGRASAAPNSPHRGQQRWQWRWDVWMPPMWVRLAECESGHRPPDWRHDGGIYEGAFGFYTGTWDRFKYAGYPDHAYDASPWMQYRVALRLFRRFGYSPWGCFRHSWVRNG